MNGVLINGISIGLLVLFTWKCFQPGMIFGKIGDWAERVLPNWLWMPILGCPVCMSVWLGGLFYAIANKSGLQVSSNFVEVLLTLFVAGGLNTCIFETLGRMQDFLINKLNQNDASVTDCQ